jgi:sugar O-acyltransferase (sialic acid O-acetyltransferase NeuD family)
MMKQIAIFGSGGFGREVAMLIELINKVAQQWELIGFYDDRIKKGEIINDYPVLGGIEDLNRISYSLAIVIAIGDPIIKRKVRHSIVNTNLFYPSLIHPNVITGNREFLSIGEGCIIGPGTVLTVNITIGKHVILSLYCTVGHDTIINDYASVMPGVNISGEVLIDECVYIGTGAKIINQLTIGKETIVAAGAVVAKSLPANCTAVGIPAKPIKFNL